MIEYYRYLRPLLFALPPELAHKLVILVMKKGWVPTPEPLIDTRLGVTCCNLGFDSPIGIAAGFDKNAEVFQQAYAQGFGFAEIGTVTPKPQSGNPRPRMFRLTEDEAVINRLGFNNHGYNITFGRVLAAKDNRLGILGINIGKNKDTEHALDDYLLLLKAAYPYADYITVNISSPNTAGLRDLQEKSSFDGFIKAIMQERNVQAAYLGYRRPVWVKIAPDMDDSSLKEMLDLMLLHKVDAVILSNTTIARPSTLTSRFAQQTGGLSGAPLTQKAQAMMKTAYAHVKDELPLIGVGGIMSAADAVARIRAGATLIQLYTGLIYHGMGLVTQIKQALLSELEKEGFTEMRQLIGVDHEQIHASME